VVERTNLIFHYRVANIFHQTAEFIGVLDVVEKTVNHSLFCQLG